MRFISRLILCLGILGLAGCVSSQRSNTQEFKEHVSFLVLPYDPNLTETNKMSAAGLPEEGFKLIAGFIKSGAKKYESVSKAKFETELGQDQKALWIFVRTVESKDSSLKKDFNEADIVRNFPGVDAVHTQNVIRLAHAIAKMHNNQKLTFCAVGTITPAKNEHKTITLEAYTYPAAKAKNFPFALPWLKVHRTETVFSLGLESPATVTYAAFDKAVLSYSFRWDKYNVGWVQPKDENKQPIVSGPIDLFKFHKTMTFNASLVESSDMKKRLDEVGEAVKGIKL